MIIPAGNISSGPAELINTTNWARDNNLEVKFDKSVEIVFVRPRSKGSQSVPPSEISGLRRVESIKMLGVTISRKFSVSQHVDNLLAVCSSHCLLCEHYDNMVYLTMLYIKCSRRLSYASPAWWGFT